MSDLPCTCTPLDGSYDSRGCPTHGPDAPRYFVDHDTIHDRITGQHVDLVEAAGMLSVEPEAVQRVAWGVVVKLGAALKNAEATITRLTKERDEARADAVLALAMDQEQIDALSAERDGLLRAVQRESARVNEAGGVQAHLVGALHEISRCATLDNAKTFAVTALANVEENRAGLWQPGPSDDAADWKPGHHRERTDAERIERQTAERIARHFEFHSEPKNLTRERIAEDIRERRWEPKP